MTLSSRALLPGKLVHEPLPLAPAATEAARCTGTAAYPGEN